MRLIKIGIANVNSTVGAFKSNTDKCVKLAEQASREKATVCIYPEAILCGYSPEDMLDWQGFTDGQWEALWDFAMATARHEFPTIHLVGLFINHGGDNYNVIAAVCQGKILGGIIKENLPTYNVFFESRKCTRGRQDFVIDINGIPFGDIMFKAPFGAFSIDDCEDSWRADGPLLRHAYSGAEINFTANASPWRIGVLNTRREMLATRSGDNLICEVYSNLIGGNDGLIFDGGGFVFQNGKPILEAKRWKEGLSACVVELNESITARNLNTTWRNAKVDYLEKNMPTRIINIPFGPTSNEQYEMPFPMSKNFFLTEANIQAAALPKNAKVEVTPSGNELFEELEQAFVLGTYDYFCKTGAFNGLMNAGSGGIDSAVTTIIEFLVAHKILKAKSLSKAQRYEEIGKGFLRVYSMPTRINSSDTKSRIANLCEELGIFFREISIQEEFEYQVAEAKKMLLPGEELDDITLQNMQARIRYVKMWNLSNAIRFYFPQNGNMSEKATGYGTIGGGDMDGGNLAIIANAPKTVLIQFLKYLGNKYDIQTAIEIADSTPSAELKEGQTDEVDLMPYAIQDACHWLFAGQKLMPLDVYRRIRQMFSDQELLAMYPTYKPGMLKQWVIKYVTLFFRNIFKWVRTPLSLHIGNLDFDRDRAFQLPVVQSMEWLEESFQAIKNEPD